MIEAESLTRKLKSDIDDRVYFFYNKITRSQNFIDVIESYKINLKASEKGYVRTSKVATYENSVLKVTEETIWERRCNMNVSV